MWKGGHIKEPLRDPKKTLLSRIYITVLCVAKDLYPGTTQTDT